MILEIALGVVLGLCIWRALPALLVAAGVVVAAVAVVVAVLAIPWGHLLVGLFWSLLLGLLVMVGMVGFWGLLFWPIFVLETSWGQRAWAPLDRIARRVAALTGGESGG
jgi:hypothetical protein